MKTHSIGYFLIALGCSWASLTSLQGAVVSTSYGVSRQVNVNPFGQNIPGDAANEPSLCIDPTNPNRIAVGWRQFDTTNSNFRQSGVAYSSDGGLNWTFPGNLEPGTFRSDPVLASDANGNFFYLGISNSTTFAEDLLRSSDGGRSWQRVGQALGGDKEWMAIDTTTSPGRGNIYQVWSPFYNVYNNQAQIFTRSTDAGNSWMTAIDLAHRPYWGTIDIGPNGEVYCFGTAYDIEPFWLNRSSDATNRFTTPTFDVSVVVDLGGTPLTGFGNLNPDGLLGQAWVAVDRSTGPRRGNVYVLCTITNDPGNWCNVVFARSTDGGNTWSAPLRLNDDSANQHAAHWFGTLSVAPNGRLDACWNDTRHSPGNVTSELYYTWSNDGGLTWAPNRPLSPSFNHSLGWPQQNKMGDYIGMVSLNECACIAYTATFNFEEDIYFVRAELPFTAKIVPVGNQAQITWNSTLGVHYCVQAVSDLSQSWASAVNVACVTATANTTTINDPLGNSARYYRVVRTSAQ